MIGSTAIFLNHEIYLVRLECLVNGLYVQSTVQNYVITNLEN
jgi:hypothetical protein